MNQKIIYTVGGTVQAGGGLYIPRRADQKLLAFCQDGKFAYVLTARQMGKSSLMVRTAETLAQEGVRSVIIDLTQLGVQVTAEEWHLGLLTAIEDALWLDTDVVEWWQNHTHLSATKRLTLFFETVLLSEVSERVVIFIDEIDSTLSLPFTDDFYAAIRYFYNARAYKPDLERLSFVLIGVATPGDLISDPKRTPFNIGQRVDLTDFTFEEALPLADGLGLSPDEARQVLAWILKWTGGHPYLTQRTCAVVAGQNRNGWSENEVDKVVANTFLGEMSEQDNNLQFVRDMLTKRAPDPLSVLEIYRDIRLGRRPVVDEEQSIVKTHLKLSGAVKREKEALVIRNRIYAEVFNRGWINGHLPADEKRRRRITLGLAFGSVVALIVAIFAVSQLLETVDTATAERETATAVAQITATAAEALLVAQDIKDATVTAEAIKEATIQAQLQATATAEVARADKATSRQLAAQAMNALDNDEQFNLDLALLLSLEANLTADTGEARSSLLAGLQRSQGLKTILHGVPTNIQSLAYSPDGQILAAGGEDGLIALWNLENNQLIGRFTAGVGAAIKSLAFSPDGQFLATAYEDGHVTMQNIDTGQVTHEFITESFETVYSLAFSPDGQILAAGAGDGFIIFWDVVAGELKENFRANQEAAVKSVAFNADGTILAAGLESGLIILWNVDEQRPLGDPMIGHDGIVWSVAFDPTGLLLASGGEDYTVRLWDVTSGRPDGEPLIAYEDGVIQVAFSPDGSLLAATNWQDKTILWDVATREPLGEPLGRAIAFAPDGQTLTTAGCKEWNQDACQQGIALLWDLTDETFLSRVLVDHQTPIFNLAFSPAKGDSTLASGDEKGAILLWDTADLRLLPKILQEEGSEVFDLAFSPDGQRLAAANGDTTVVLWDVTTGDPALPPFFEHKYWVFSLAFSPQGDLIASGSCEFIDQNAVCTAGEIRLWDAKTGDPQGEPLIGHKGAISDLAFYPDGKILASGGEDGIIILWDVETGQQAFPPLTGHTVEVASLAFSPEGDFLASGSCSQYSDDGRYCNWGELFLWDLQTRQRTDQLFEGQHGFVRRLAFSPDGNTLASGTCREHAEETAECISGGVYLWDVVSGQPIGEPFPGYTAEISGVAFRADGNLLAAADKAGNIILWDINRESWFDQACRVANRNLSQIEWNEFFGPEAPYEPICPDLPFEQEIEQQ